jgi:modulator of FtsH protease HflC
MKSTGLLVLLIVGLFVGNMTFYTLPEGVQALVTQFGKIQGEPVTTAGLKFKLPWQNVRYFDKRILTWDGDAEQIPTKDKKYIIVDTTARWKIKNVRKFAESVISERGARDRLDGILDGATRDVISNQNLVEAVRNSNTIIKQLADAKKALKDKRKAKNATNADEVKKDVTKVVEELAAAEELAIDIEKIHTGRDKLSKLIITEAREQLGKFGIELIDVQLRSISYIRSVETKVYDRMISERQRIAERIRSVGKGEEAKIRGTLNKDLKKIESEAYRKSQIIKGKAEGQSIQIYAKSLKADPKYYKFTRTLEAYKKTMPKGEFILSTESDFLNLLQKNM